jgi:hypothetical protein
VGHRGDHESAVAGWYKLGASPGERGNAVILGHVDAAKTGPAVSYDLGRLARGDTVQVDREDGTIAIFTVEDVKSHRKQLPIRAGLRTIRPPRPAAGHLRRQLRQERNYLNNVIVFAHLTKTQN